MAQVYQIKRRDLETSIFTLLEQNKVTLREANQFLIVVEKPLPRISRVQGDDILEYKYVVDFIQSRAKSTNKDHALYPIATRERCTKILDTIIELLDPKTDQEE